MDKTRRFEGGMLFCGANSGSGFVSFFDDILKGVEKTYILKGGPGTGKSYFMRRAAEYASERGLPVEYYACSSDPDSLDAIVVDGRIAIADGTAPHVLEARAIGARDEIVDLGAFWDPDALSGKVDEIESLGAKKSACYRRAYAYLKAERELSDVCRTLVLPYFKYEKALRAVDRLFSELKTGGANTCRHRVGMIDSIGMKGRVRLDTFEFFAEKIYAVDDAFGTSGLILQMIYDKEAYDSEKYIAKKLFKLDSMCASIDLRDIDSFIDREALKSGMSYASLQRRAISDALRYGVMILTGGPGTGKTTVVKALINIFESMGYDVALAAPTGRAAKRMSEATSKEAKTIHRLLEYSFDAAEGYSFGRNETNLLDEQVVIVDEASMIDNILMCALLKAIKPGARFIIIGDSDQLPSVGAGNVLCDIIDSNRFATVKLTEIFRQARESLIITNAHAVNNGEMPQLNVKNNDFFFLKRGSDRDIAMTVADLCANRLPKTYKEIGKNGIQVISPSRKGESGTESLNILLQKMLNPQSAYKKEYKFRDRVFREGDRVMQTRNNYDIEWSREADGKYGFGIFNGDIGTVEKISTADSSMTIAFDDRTVIYDFSLLEDLEHAYAITVHKSQGSEYPIVIIPACHAPSMLLSRNLLYTAITRAEKMVIIVGFEDIVSQMVGNHQQKGDEPLPERRGARALRRRNVPAENLEYPSERKRDAPGRSGERGRDPTLM